MGRPTPLQIPAAVRARYAAGELTAAGVAQACGVSVTTALKALRAAGVDTSRRSRARYRRGAVVTTALDPALVERYRRGELTRYDVARLCGVAPSTALRTLRRAGADTNRGTRHRVRFLHRPGVAERVRAILRLYRQGYGLTHIGRTLGLSAPTVRFTLKRIGVAPTAPDHDGQAAEPAPAQTPNPRARPDAGRRRPSRTTATPSA